MRAGGLKDRVKKGACAVLATCAAALLGACAASTSYAGIPLAAGGADSDLQSLARRAQAGDKQAQLELGIRYEEGRGVEADPEAARRLYRSSLRGARFQTAYVPAGGAVVPQNSAIGSNRGFWPRNFGEIQGYHPSRIAALLRLCGLNPGSLPEPDCRQEAGVLRHLAQFEANFRACRISTKLGDAGTHPAPFLFNAIDHDRRIETRRCMLEGPVPIAMPRDQSLRIWTMWLALTRFAGCAATDSCPRGDIRRSFTREVATYREDSLTWFAMRDALRHQPRREIQVGGSWWWALCGFMPEEPRIVPTDVEKKICTLIETLDLTE